MFSLDAVLELVLGREFNTGKTCTMRTRTVHLSDKLGYINSSKARAYFLDFMSVREFYTVRNWLSMCRLLGIELKGDVTMEYIKQETEKLGLSPSVLFMLKSHGGNHNIAKPYA